ncbi:MAG: hypothetical protein CVU97_00655 [Firmicutes bacterium HGW-Firmicutes-21]|nr:MAG: hypothetical protein CVU97_00655 [Firmicutes bacterium HGW-Firmicutes-21]
MKRFMRIAIPIFLGLGLALAIIFCYLTFFTGAFSPEKAVMGYLKASMTQDVSGMLKYSSEYQKIVLYGNKDLSNKKLKENLKTAYKGIDNIYADSKITFSIDSITEIEKNSDEYANVLDAYEYMTGKTNISAVTQVVIKVFVDGKQKQKSTVYAVKSGISWYYTDI